MKTREKKGISLIVLVITIVVMIILASSIILSLNSDRTITKAKEARNATDIANAKDIVSVAKGEWVLDKDIIMEDDATITSFVDYANKKLVESGYNVTEAKAGAIEVTEKGMVYAYPAIPSGFTASIYEGEKKVTEGFVIYKTDAATLATKDQATAQTTYDQFVWVPVTNMDDFKITGWENNAPVNITGTYNEPYSSGYSTEVAEYNAMKRSVEKYGGFYIARYEAGDGDATAARTTYTTGAHTVVSRKGAFVYNHVSWGATMSDITSDVMDSSNNNKGKGVVHLSQNMYPQNNGYTTNLIYGVQWDATLRWLSDKYNVTDSRSWGNYSNSDGAAATNSGSLKINYTTGRNEAWKAKNIYDLAGNMNEWTMEASSPIYRVLRGASCIYNGRGAPASYRSSGTMDYTSNDSGFRPVLYLN